MREIAFVARNPLMNDDPLEIALALGYALEAVGARWVPRPVAGRWETRARSPQGRRQQRRPRAKHESLRTLFPARGDRRNPKGSDGACAGAPIDLGVFARK